jgi:nucleotide-binding universal stress UspA family protein
MKIIIGVDGREHQFDPVLLAGLLAGPDDEIVVAHVYPFDWVAPPVGPMYDDVLRKESEPIVEAAGRALGRPFKSAVLGDTSPARGLHRLAERERADLLVLGASHRTRAGQIMLGSVGERMVHGAPCAIAVAPRGFADGDHGIRRVGVAYDGSPDSRAALAWAEDLARAKRADLTLYRRVETPSLTRYPAMTAMNAAVEDAARRQEEELRHAVASVPPELRPRGEILRGKAADVLAAASAEQDLIVAGSRGYGAVRTVLLGSVSRRLLAHAQAPVVILPRTAAARSEPIPEPQPVELGGASPTTA